MRPGAVLLVVGLAGLGSGCEKRQTSARRPVRSPALPAVRPDSGALPVVPAPQRAHDRRHRDAFLKIHKEIKGLFQEMCRVQKKGARSFAVRARWPALREDLLSRAGRLRARALALDPLGRQSRAGPLVLEVLRDLSVSLPDAVQESWRPETGGAFLTRKKDVAGQLARLRRYLAAL